MDWIPLRSGNSRLLSLLHACSRFSMDAFDILSSCIMSCNYLADSITTALINLAPLSIRRRAAVLFTLEPYSAMYSQLIDLLRMILFPTPSVSCTYTCNWPEFNKVSFLDYSSQNPQFNIGDWDVVIQNYWQLCGRTPSSDENCPSYSFFPG